MSKPLYRKSGSELEHDASTGSAEALATLSIMVEHGWRGLAQDSARALDLERRAAAAGSPRAARWLGDRYYRGDGVEKSQTEALSWWRRAAEAGDVDAMANLIPLMKSANAEEAAEGRKWLALAAAAGQPYAINTLRHQDKSAAEMTLAEFAKLSLEEIAARAEAAADELSVTYEDLEATAAQLDTLAGDWIERVRARWTDATASAEVSGDPVDFPGPAFEEVITAVVDGDDTIEVTLHAGVRHLQLDVARYGETWSLILTSFEPHPAAEEQRWLVDELRAAAAAVGLALPA